MRKGLLFIFLMLGFAVMAEEYPYDDYMQEESLMEQSLEEVKVTFLNGKLTIENAPMNARVEIFSMLGVAVYQEYISSPMQYFLLDLKKGYYVVKVGTITRKISVK